MRACGRAGGRADGRACLHRQAHETASSKIGDGGPEEPTDRDLHVGPDAIVAEPTDRAADEDIPAGIAGVSDV